MKKARRYRRTRRIPAPLVECMDIDEYAAVRRILQLSHSRKRDTFGIPELTSKRWGRKGPTRLGTILLRLAVALKQERHIIAKIVRSTVHE